jgi:hypothetical protein
VYVPPWLLARCWQDGAVNPRDTLHAAARRTHPRTAGAAAQVAVLLAAVLLGLVLGSLLRYADDRSWSGSRTTTAVITGLQTNGVHATADGRDIVLHLEKVPRSGTQLAIEIRPDGRARPASYRQTWRGALLSGIGLTVALAVLVQVYRFAVTRRP